MIEFIPASRNLGCSAIKIGDIFYADYSKGMVFVKVKAGRYWESFYINFKRLSIKRRH